MLKCIINFLNQANGKKGHVQNIGKHDITFNSLMVVEIMDLTFMELLKVWVGA